MSLEESPHSCGESLHPASLILIWLAFALCIPWLRFMDLAVISLLATIPLLRRRSAGFRKLLRRTRWLLLSLVLVYAFATPGEAVLPALGGYSPSHEGLLSGGQQALRLITLLATLALLLDVLPRDRILAGLYLLLKPLAHAGVDIDRIAIRVWLTLYYAEHAEPGSQADWRERLQAVLEHDEEAGQTVQLDVDNLSRTDYVVLAVILFLLGLLVLRGAA
jgi:energy-coupling factor transport system permease protein